MKLLRKSNESTSPSVSIILCFYPQESLSNCRGLHRMFQLCILTANVGWSGCEKYQLKDVKSFP